MISIIVAMSKKDRVIGKDNDLPWNIPEDLKHFKETTKGHPIIMGRKTFESIGRPLPKRTNIIVTRNIEYGQDGAIVVHSLEEAIEEAKQHDDQLFIIGGASIYKEALEKDLVDQLIITEVVMDVEGDTFFPELDDSNWVKNSTVNLVPDVVIVKYNRKKLT